MPELPDIEAYLAALRGRIVGRKIERIRLESPFFLRTVEPKLECAAGREVRELRRIGKRIAIGLEEDLWLVIHLMIAGRLHWREANAKLAARRTLAAIDFANGSLTITEAGSKRRASLHVLRGETALAAIDPGGIDPLSCTLEDFVSVMTRENHTLKRSLTDPRLLAGIGNAYSDEILHAARMSPILQTAKLTPAQWRTLFEATRATLILWRDRFLAEAGKAFPEKVTAFRPEMAAHGRFNLPCPRCGDPIQRIRYADNETNYCATCQTEGKLLADRSLSRLLGKDWPKTLDELELLKRPR
jgi:formamidopyrimidine-DNA glycosylase